MSRIWASANSGLAPSAWTAAERTLARLRNSLDEVIVHQDRDPVEALAAVVRDRITTTIGCVVTPPSETGHP